KVPSVEGVKQQLCSNPVGGDSDAISDATKHICLKQISERSFRVANTGFSQKVKGFFDVESASRRKRLELSQELVATFERQRLMKVGDWRHSVCSIALREIDSARTRFATAGVMTSRSRAWISASVSRSTASKACMIARGFSSEF